MRGSLRSWREDWEAESLVSLGEASVTHVLHGAAWYGQWSAEPSHAAQAGHAQILWKRTLFLSNMLSKVLYMILALLVFELGGKQGHPSKEDVIDWGVCAFSTTDHQGSKTNSSQAKGYQHVFVEGLHQGCRHAAQQATWLSCLFGAFWAYFGVQQE